MRVGQDKRITSCRWGFYTASVHQPRTDDATLSVPRLHPLHSLVILTHLFNRSIVHKKRKFSNNNTTPPPFIPRHGQSSYIEIFFFGQFSSYKKEWLSKLHILTALLFSGQSIDQCHPARLNTINTNVQLDIKKCIVMGGNSSHSDAPPSIMLGDHFETFYL